MTISTIGLEFWSSFAWLDDRFQDAQSMSRMTDVGRMGAHSLGQRMTAFWIAHSTV